MNYRELQKWAKARGIRANQKKAVLQKAWDKAQNLGGENKGYWTKAAARERAAKASGAATAGVRGSYKKGFAAPGLDAVTSGGLPLTG